MSPRRRTSGRPPRRWLRDASAGRGVPLSSLLRDGLLALAVALAIAYVATRLPGERFAGGARAIDGDSLELGGREVRLYGIDAPEAEQRCTGADGRPWDCGRAAAAALADLIRDGGVRCEALDRDRYGRMVGRCSAGGRDLGQAMVGAGHAVAYTAHAPDYVPAEAAARRAKRGIWQGDFERPSVWREKHRTGAGGGDG